MYPPCSTAKTYQSFSSGNSLFLSFSGNQENNESQFDLSQNQGDYFGFVPLHRQYHIHDAGAVAVTGSEYCWEAFDQHKNDAFSFVGSRISFCEFVHFSRLLWQFVAAGQCSCTPIGVEVADEMMVVDGRSLGEV